MREVPIPLADLRAQHEEIAEPIQAAISRVLSRGWFILGQEVARFEEDFARYCGVAEAVGVGSGTEALHLALVALGAGPGREVIAPANTAVPTLSAISFSGAQPVLVDVDPATSLIDPVKIEKAITPRTAIILPVHLYGQCAPIDRIEPIAARHGIPILEDAAQAHGATHHSRKAGSLAVAAAFSFYPSKNLGACGDGGMVTTDDTELAGRVRRLRNYGERERDHHVEVGFNSRLDEMQAAILSAKLPYLDRWNEKRREMVARYREALSELSIGWNEEAPGNQHVRHLAVVRLADRDRFRTFLEAKGIQTRIHYPTPVHLQEAYAFLGHNRGDFPVAEALAAEIVSLPLYPEMPPGHQDRVIEAIREWFRKRS